MSRILARQLRRTQPATITNAFRTAYTSRHRQPFSSTPGFGFRAWHPLDLDGGMELTEDQQAVREGVAAVCARFRNKYWRERDQTATDPVEFHAAMAEGGWLGIALPESLGGSGLGITEACIMMQTITESGAGMAGAQSIHANLYATQPLAAFGSPDQLKNIIPAIVSGQCRVCFGVTEPDAGLDTLSIKTVATKVETAGAEATSKNNKSNSTNNGDELYSIKGQKIWITAAQVAHKMVLLARTWPLEGIRRSDEHLSLYCIDLDRSAPGLKVRQIAKMGSRAVDANEVFFDDYRVPASTLIGEAGAGFRTVLHGMNAERCLLAAEALGLGYVALSRASNYAREREVFGRPIGKNQGIAHPLADSYMQLEAAKLATYHAARLYDRAKAGDASITIHNVGIAANTAKYLAAEAAFKACERAILTHGGMGYAVEYDVERYMREIFVPRIAPVSREMVLNYMSEKVLRLPRSY